MKPLLFLLISLFYLNGFSQQTITPLRHFMQRTPASANAIPYGANPRAGRYADAGGAKIYYEVYGKGQPIVILHGGIFGFTYEMHQFIDSLKKNYQVIAISTRGHGKSELGTEPITYEQKANDVLAVINTVTRNSVTVLGFSDGGFTGFKLASMYPDRVKKLVAIGASEYSAGDRSFHFDPRQAIALDSLYWKQQFKLMPEPQRLQEMFTKLAAMYNQLSIDKAFLSTIKCPVLVMAGALDQSNPPQRMLNTARMIPNSQLSIIPNSTHGVFLENFPAVWASLTPFLQQ